MVKRKYEKIAASYVPCRTEVRFCSQAANTRRENQLNFSRGMKRIDKEFTQWRVFLAVNRSPVKT